MEYYLVIVNYNNSDVTINCIQSTKKYWERSSLR